MDVSIDTPLTSDISQSILTLHMINSRLNPKVLR
jgi:hypothetical protein